jgi:lipopolysaccharide export system permease protein
MLIVTISLVFDFTENVDEFIEKKVSFKSVFFDYYIYFIPYFANLFSPLFIFISVIFFTSKMASNTEIVAILASGVSFWRILRPYLVCAIFLGMLSFFFNSFLIPVTSEKRLDFKYKYIKNPFKNKDKHIHMQLDSNSYAYIGDFTVASNTGIKFALERFNKDLELEYKLMADYVRWDSTKNKWTIQNYYERFINGKEERIRRGLSKDTSLNMSVKDFSSRNIDVEMLNYFQLNEEIEARKFKGTRRVVYYQIEKHERFAYAFAAIILTVIGMAISSRKVRGGIGMHLGLGIGLSFTYILFMKVAQTFSINGGMDPFITMLLPNIVFSIIAVYLLLKAPK